MNFQVKKKSRPLDIVYWKKTNKETLEAIKEAKEGKNLSEIDMTSMETFLKSFE
jgi:antitoxin component of RelBE/YafQ-DinJ toxin-antitoxin module